MKTKDVDVNAPVNGGFTPKQLTPGNNECVIRSIRLDRAQFILDKEAYHVILNLEGRPLANFEGFLIDPKDESKGRFAGQSAYVKMSEYTYQDGETTGGVKIIKDDEIIKDLKRLCIELGCLAWIDAADDDERTKAGKPIYATVNQLIEAFNTEQPFKDIWMHYCLAGKTYVNKTGHTAYELFLPRVDKLGRPYSKDKAKVQTFFQSAHVRPVKVKADPATNTFAAANQPTTKVEQNGEPVFKDDFLEDINKAVPVTHTDIVGGDNTEELPFSLD